MARLNLILLMAVMASALYLVHIEYQSRQLFTALHGVRSEARQLELDHSRLLGEKGAQATPLRVERLAKEQLKMRTTTPAITQYVRADGTVIPALVPAPVAAPAPAAGAPKRRTAP